jgi:uncharacterized protein YceK
MSGKWILIVMLAAVTLSGCASVKGLREKAPDLDIETTKSPSDVGQCVANGWGEFMGVTVNHGVNHNGDYYVSMPSQYTGNNGIMDAKAQPSGKTRVLVRFRLSGLGGYTKFERVVRTCAN